MLQDKTILVVGGDLRQAHLAKLLSKHNQVRALGLEKAEGLDGKITTVDELKAAGTRFDYIVFPMPVGSDSVLVNTPFSAKKLKIEDVLALASHEGGGTCVLGGKLSEDLIARLEELGLPYADYYLREELAILNAVPTVFPKLQRVCGTQTILTRLAICSGLLQHSSTVSPVICPC